MFSTMSGKLAGLLALNTDTTTNEFCIKRNAKKALNNICAKCYSFAMLLKHRKNCVPKFQRNSEFLSRVELKFTDVPVINQAWVRFSGHGELINALHFANLCTIAEKNPHCNFALWTKRVTIVRNHKGLIPPNMILIFSNPTIGKIIDPPRGFHKSFNNVESGSAELTRDRLRKKIWRTQDCTGQKCIDCLACYSHNGKTVIIENVK